MRKSITLLLSLIVLATFAQSTTTSFMKTFGGSSDETSTKLIQISDGDYYMLSTTESYGSGNQDVMLTRTNGLGDVSWGYAYGTSGNDVATNMVLTNDGGILVTGYTDGGGNDHINGMVLKITNTGVLSWSKYYYNDSFSVAFDAVESRFGGYYIVGAAHDDSLDNNIMVSSLSSTGNNFWTKSYGGLNDEMGLSIGEDVVGRLVIAGYTANDSINIGTTGDRDVQVLRLWTTGAVSWVKNYGTSFDEEGLNIVIDRDEYYITGYTGGTSFPSKSMFVLNIDSSSTIGFVNGYGTLEEDEGNGFALRPNGDYVLAGPINQTSSSGDIALIYSNASGVVLQYTIIGNDSIDGAGMVSLSNAQEGGYNILASGRSYTSGGDNDIYLMKTENDASLACGSKIDLLDAAIVNFSTDEFDYSFDISNGSSLTISRTSVSTSDSTLCCSLSARIAADSIVMCTNDNIRLGGSGISGYSYSWTEIGGSWTSSSANPTVSPSSNTTYKLVVSDASGDCTSDSATVYVTVNSRLTGIDFARDSFFCESDTITVSAYPGMNSYTWTGNGYIKSGESVQLSAQDTITLTVIDQNSCVYKDTVVVLEIPTPVFSLGPDTTVCENLPVTLTGPAGMMDYKWNGQSGSNQSLTTATQQYHSLEVMDSFGCTFYDEVLVQTVPFASFDLGPDTSFCPGGSFVILGPGALTGYIWNDTASSYSDLTVNEVGTYHLTAFNSYSCPYSDTVVITAFTLPSFSLGNDTGYCEGGSVLLFGPTMLTAYQWSNGTDMETSSYEAGTAWLKVTDDNGCNYTDSVEIEEFANPDITLGPDTIICFGESITLSPGSGFASYLWNTSAQSSTLLVTEKGTYSVTVTDNNGCEGQATVDVDTTTCSKESIHYLGATRISIYPNPTSKRLNFESEGSMAGAYLELIDMYGKVVYQEEIISHQLSVDVSNLPAGTYQVGVRKDNNQLYFRVIVSH